MRKQSFQVDIEFLANISDLQNKIKTVTGEIGKMGSTSGGAQVQKQFDQLSRTIENLHTRAQQPINSQAEFNKLVSDVSRAEMAYDSLIGSVERMRGLSDGKKIELLDPEQQKIIQGAASAVKTYESVTADAAKKQRELEQAQERVAQQKAKIAGIKTAQQEAAGAVQRHRDKLVLLEASQEDVINAENRLKQATEQGAGEEVIAELTLKLQQAKVQAEELGVKFTKTGTTTQAFSAAIEKTNKDIDRLTQSSQNISLAKDLGTATVELDRLEQELKQLQGQNPTAQLKSAFEELKAKAESLGVSLEGIDDINSVEQLKQRLLQLKQQGLDQVDAKIDGVAASMNGDLRPALNNVRSGLNDATSSFQQFNAQAQEVEQLKSQLGYFFSLTNSVYLLRSALQSAFETVKELDAVMTETAVVTEFSVGDMWEKLPEYAAQASNLGSSIKDVYAATTLYYQQGLKTNEAMSVGVETMKMARIAGMEAADATQAMTAALRGFNMEVNETNALRVNDVYSNLAAITAADTEQIATAMSKTASIAASANMEFETTAALLAQIIETTQEAPETAGTALKTIIARFSEVKELQNQGKTTGEDSEGESIDVNKIDKALGSVGISMDAFFAGTEGLDSVLMRLAEKWDTLDFTTQRYIATMAAGSRQQSRFIAMMSDYARTTQLVSAANNSAGASQKQFDKTMESLEAKLNKLKVAWDQFTMGIADNQLIKTGIDLLTGLLETINKILNCLPGLTQSFASLALVFVALRAGGALLNKALAGISGIVAKGFIDAGVVAAKTAETSGKIAGTKMITGAAKGVNNPAAQAGLFKSYNLLLFKVQSTLPPVTIKTVSQITPTDMASLEALRTKMKQVAVTAGVQSKEYQLLKSQYRDMITGVSGTALAYQLEGKAAEGLTVKQNRLLASKVKEGAITTTQIALLGPEAAARVADAFAAGKEADEIEELVAIKTAEATLRAGGIGAFFTEIGLRVMGKTATDAETVSVWGLVKAKLAEAAAWIKANAAMLTGILVVAAVVAGIVLVISGITKLVNTFKDMKNGTAELAKINEQLAQVNEQVKEASQEMNDLADSQSGLESLQETFEGLTKGTAEWKQKLVEVNSKVLELLDKYPELAGYIIRGENGELQIQDEGWEVMNQAAYDRYNLMAQSSIGLQTQKTAAEQEIAFEGKQSEYYQNKISWAETMDSTEGKTGAMYVGGGIGLAGGAIAGAKIGGMAGTMWGPLGTIIGGGVGILVGAITGLGATYLGPMLGYDEEYYQKQATGGLTEKQYTEFAATAAERGIGWQDTVGLENLFKEMGYDQFANWQDVGKQIISLGEDFDDLANSALALELAQEAYTDSFLSQAATNANLGDHAYIDQALEIQGENFDNLDERIEQKVEDMDKNLSEDQIQQYANLTGKTIDQVNKEISDKTLSEDTIKQVLATNEVQKEAQQAMKKTTEALTLLAARGKDVSAVFNVLSKEGQDLKLEDINKFKQASQIEDLSEVTTAEDQKNAVVKFLASQGTSLETLGLAEGDQWRVIWENLVSGADRFNDSLEKAAQWGGEFDTRVSSSAIQGITDKINQQATQGSQNVAGIMGSMQNFITSNNLDAEQAQLFYEALSSINWDEINEVEGLSDNLEDLGFDMKILGTSINDLEADIIDFAESTYNLSPEEQAEEVQQTKDLEAKIRSGSTAFTKEEVAQFSAAEQKNFISDGQNYYYFGSLDSQGMINDIYKQAGMKTSTDDEIQAYHNYEAMKSSTGQTVKVNIQESQTNYDDNKVLQTEVYKNTSGDQAKWNLGGKGIPLLKSTSNGQKEEIAENSMKAKALTFYKEKFSSELFGEEYESAASWYNALDPYGQLYWSGIAATVYTEFYDDTNQEWIDPYKTMEVGGETTLVTNGLFNNAANWSTLTSASGWRNLLGGELSGTGTITTETDADFMSKLGGANAYQFDDGMYGRGEIGTQTYDTARIHELYAKYIPTGTATTVADKQAALYEYYNNNKNTATNFSINDFYQNLATKSPQELYEATKSDWDKESDAASNVLKGQVGALEGGEIVVGKWTEQLKTQNSTLSSNTALLQALMIAYNKRNKAIDSFHSTLKNDAKLLEKGAEAGQIYYEALGRLTTQAQLAFGSQVDSKYIEAHKDWFLALAEGGEEAQIAYEKINEDLTKTYMQTKGLGALTPQVATLMSTALASVNPGDSLDLTSLYGKLMLMEGMTQEAAKHIMDQWGFELTYDTQTKWVDELGNLYDSKPEGIKTVEVQMVTGVKESGTGSGSQFSNVTEDSGGAASEYENSYDKLHNTLEQINDTIREREKLERRYQSLLDRQLLTLKEARELYNRTMDSYQTEAGYQRYIIQERYQQIEDEIEANPGMEKYVQIVDDGYGGKSIRIDWEAFEEKVGSEWEEGEDVSAFYDAIKEWLDGIYEAEEVLDDIADGMWELINRGKDQYLDLEDQIIEALVNERQEEIDKLSEINDSINDTNSRILDSLQEQLDNYRQQRDNEKTEEEISDKQRRLAYLQQDTSGANQLEILQLQEEIDEATEDYTDTLIDQKISELQRQNDQAAEQRQRQIDIMQAQLDYDQETGAFNAKAEQLIEEVMANNGILSGTELEGLLKDEANWDGMSKLDKVKWLDDLSKMLAEALDYRGRTTTIDDLMEAGKLKEGQKIKFKTTDGKEVEGTVQKDGTIKDKDGNVYSDVTRDWLGNYSTTEKYAGDASSQQPETPQKPQLTTNDKKGVSAAIWNGGYGWGSGKTRTSRLKEVFGDNDIQKNYVNKGVRSGYSGKLSDYSYSSMKKKFTAFETGGLADFTGPAWLDGTKSKPEYILNADQTKAFFTLVDILSGLRDSKTSTTQNSGDSIYDIDINVESIGSDYDVDQLADKVKSLINEDARYRNNNVINLMR